MFIALFNRKREAIASLFLLSRLFVLFPAVAIPAVAITAFIVFAAITITAVAAFRFAAQLTPQLPSCDAEGHDYDNGYYDCLHGFRLLF